MRVLRKIMAITLAMTLVLSMGAMTAMAGDKAVPNVGDGASPEGLSSITIDDLTLEVGKTEEMKYTIAPVGVSGVTFTWTSSDSAVANVTTETGVVTAIAAGKAKIKVIAALGISGVADVWDEATVTVTEKPDPTPPTVNKEELIKAVSTAETAMAAVQSSNDGADVPTDKTWATPADIATFKKAIDSAKEVVKDKEATQDNVVTAVIVLEKAHDAFSTTVKPGTKEEDKPVDPDKSGNADIRDMHYSVDGGENQRVENFETTTLNYKVVLPLGFSSVELIPTLPEKDVAGDITVQTEATKENNTAIVTVVSQDGKHTNTYKVTFTVKGTINPPPSGGGGGGSTPPPSQNTANDPETAEKVNDTIAALKDPTKELPKEAVKTTIAGGAGITVIPLKLTSGSASLGTDIFNTIGSAPATVGLKLTVSSGVAGGSAEIIIPGGFGKITEPGRFNFPMDYETKAASNDTMLKAVKGDNAVSMTAKVGGNFTLPVTATVTVPTKLVNGSNVNIYKYDPVTDKLIVVGKAVVKDGKITFATKMMGELLFTTGTV